MSNRAIPWRNKPTSNIQETLDSAAQLKLYLLQETGPTSFVFRDESQNKFKVSIGREVTCTCDPHKKDHCIHTLYVLLKIFKMNANNPLIWQASYLDPEIGELIRNRYNPQTDRPKKIEKFLKRSSNLKVKKTTSALRQNINEEDLCPICHENMTKEEGIAYCKKSCGNNFHFKCILIWAEHKNLVGDSISCPMCRCDWGKNAYGELVKEFEEFQSQLILHKGHKCGTCKGNKQKYIKGRLFHCIHCDSFEICEACFLGFEHYEHNRYLIKETIDDEWRPAPNREKVVWNQKDFDEINIEDLKEKIPKLKLMSEKELNFQKFILSCFSDASSTIQNQEGNYNILSIVGLDVKKSCSYCHSDNVNISKLKRLLCGHFLHGHCILEMMLDGIIQCPEEGEFLLKGYRSAFQEKLKILEEKQEKKEIEPKPIQKIKAIEESKLPNKKLNNASKRLDLITLDIKGKGIVSENNASEIIDHINDKYPTNYKPPLNLPHNRLNKPPLYNKNNNKINFNGNNLPPIIGLQGNNIQIDQLPKVALGKKPLSTKPKDTSNCVNTENIPAPINIKNFRIVSTSRRSISSKTPKSLPFSETELQDENVIMRVPLRKKSIKSKISSQPEKNLLEDKQENSFDQLDGWN